MHWESWKNWNRHWKLKPHFDWGRIFKKPERRADTPSDKEKQSIYEELLEAQNEWQHAQRKLDYVLDPDQIDYVIYAMEAAEKRYDMLLKRAKRHNIHVLQDGLRKVADG